MGIKLGVRSQTEEGGNLGGGQGGIFISGGVQVRINVQGSGRVFRMGVGQ